MHELEQAKRNNREGKEEERHWAIGRRRKMTNRPLEFFYPIISFDCTLLQVASRSAVDAGQAQHETKQFFSM